MRDHSRSYRGPLLSSVSCTKNKKLPQHVAALSVCSAAIAAGTVLGWTANISEEMKRSEYNGIAIDDSSLGWIGSFATLGAAALCFPIGMICDLLGRRWGMLVLVLPFTVGWLFILYANGLIMIYIGRFLTGMAGCAFCVSAPLYTSEIAEKEIRGILGTYFELLLCVGVLIAYILAILVNIKTYTALCATLPIVFAIIFFFQPETPVYRLRQGRDEEARAILVRLRGNSLCVDEEMDEIRRVIDEDAKNDVSVWTSLRRRTTQKAFLICFGLMVLQQWGGINAVIFYTTDIFESAGVRMGAKMATIAIGVVQAVGTFASTLVVDRWGRRTLLIASGTLTAVFGLLLGGFLTLRRKELIAEGSCALFPVFALCGFVLLYSIGLGPIPWIIPAEVFPPEVKSFGGSAAGTVNWLAAFAITKVYFYLNESLGIDGTFYLFAAITFLCAVFVYFLLPETKGKTLDEIQCELNGVNFRRQYYTPI